MPSSGALAISSTTESLPFRIEWDQRAYLADSLDVTNMVTDDNLLAHPRPPVPEKRQSHEMTKRWRVAMAGQVTLVVLQVLFLALVEQIGTSAKLPDIGYGS